MQFNIIGHVMFTAIINNNQSLTNYSWIVNKLLRFHVNWQEYRLERVSIFHYYLSNLCALLQMVVWLHHL